MVTVQAPAMTSARTDQYRRVFTELRAAQDLAAEAQSSAADALSERDAAVKETHDAKRAFEHVAMEANLALEAARAQVDAWDAAVAARVVATAGPSAGAAASEVVAGPRWAAAAPMVDALLGLDLPAPVRADVEAARAELRKTAAALRALDAVGAAPDPEDQRSQRRTAVMAGLVARFDALLGSLEDLLLEQAARRVQADDPVVARVRDQVARSVALREVEGAMAGRDVRSSRPAGGVVRQG